MESVREQKKVQVIIGIIKVIEIEIDSDKTSKIIEKLLSHENPIVLLIEFLIVF